jgi:hypothetical protein
MDEPYRTFKSTPKVMSPPATLSKASSRSEFPLTSQSYQGHHKVTSYDSVSADDAPVLQREDIYERTMSWWRVGIRRKLVVFVKAESEIIARMQVSSVFLQ